MEHSGFDAIPEAWKAGAEEIRQHLVALRGGAIFLSPADALQILQWMERGVPVVTILRATERAHEARRRKRSRIPFGLGQVKRHLKALQRGSPSLAAEPVRAEPVRAEPREEEPIFGALAGQVFARAAGDPHQGALEAFAQRLLELPDADQDTLVRGALGALRDLRQAIWDGTGEEGKRRARAQAQEALEVLGDAVDEATRVALIEEEAREVVRAGYAWLSAATIWDVVEGSWLP